MYASIQLHCLDSHTQQVAILKHTLARASTGQAGSQRASLLLSARKKRMRMITFLGSFSSSFFVLPGNSVRMLPAFRQGMRPFPGMHLSCALFLDRISTWWAREIVRRSLFFSCTFFTWHASLWRSGLSMNLTLPIKKLRSSFLRLIRDRECLCAGKGSFFHTI